MNLKIEATWGEDFNKTAARAKEIANQKNANVEFNFNGIACVVNKETVTDWLYRDYTNAHIMGWSTVGPDCEMVYDVDVMVELRKRQLDAAKKQKMEVDEMRQSDLEKQRIVEEKIRGVVFLVHPDKQEEYEAYILKNSTDGYSLAVVDYADTWAKLMEIEISKGRTKISEIADECQTGLDYLGITGFQYGCAVSSLVHFWVFGEELRQWHNAQYGAPTDAKGTVNPAILTLKTKDQ